MWKYKAVAMPIDERYKISLGKNKEILDAELWGISEAMKVTLKEKSKKTYKITAFLNL